MIRIVVFTALVALGCGGGTEPSPGSSGGEQPTESCAGYTLDDACVNEDNLAECRRREAQCPGEVQVMESCPLQFGCP